ncbi:MAG: AbrB/MazE/SpoVT family DNA-binding domain-containing protein [Ktedonobacteraceae bacterium]
MQEFISSINSEGQVIIPMQVLNHLRLKMNDEVAFMIDDNGIVRIQAHRYPEISSLRGAAGSLKQQLTWERIQQIAQEDRFDTKDEG